MRGAPPFARILWIKSVTLDGGYAYGPPHPSQIGGELRLHAAEDDAESLGEPTVSDMMVLTQHDQVTHLVEVVGDGVQATPRRSPDRSIDHTRFPVYRRCTLVMRAPFEEAPFITDAFGFDPNAKGGEVFSIAALEALARAGRPLWMVQRRVVRALEGELPEARRARRRQRARERDADKMRPLKDERGRAKR